MTIKTEYAPGEFCWVDLMAKEMDAAKAWYADLFGWTYEEQDTGGGPRYGQFYKDGKVVAGLGQMGEEMKGAGMPSMWNSYVSVEDVGAVATRAAELGGSVMMPAMDVMDVGKMAILQSPEGAALAVWQPGKHVGAELCNADGAFCWNELSTRDLEDISFAQVRPLALLTEAVLSCVYTDAECRRAEGCDSGDVCVADSSTAGGASCQELMPPAK